MPGISLVCDLESQIQNHLVAHLSNEGVRQEGEFSSILWRDQHLVLLSSGYPEYPITVHETPDHLVCIEGRIYQAPEFPLIFSPPAIAADILSGESHAVARAARCLAQIDGDFVITVLDRHSHDVVVFNDFLGRLPLYVYRTDCTLIVSRDLSLVMRGVGTVTFDRLAAAEHLLYGYPLGPRTLFSKIERLAAGVAIQIHRQARRIKASTLLVPSVVSDRGVTTEKLKGFARELSVAFTKACAVRVEGADATTLSLSGGLDSRSVAAALWKKRLPFLAVTQSTNPNDVETRLAGKVASVLQLNWRTFSILPPTGSDLLRLLQLKSGMNYLGMAFLLPFFDSLQAEFGRGMVLLTGDGGDKILPDHRPRMRIVQRKSLMDYVLANHEIFPLVSVAALTGVSRLDILAALEARLASYPEDNLVEKYVHFILFERAFKWLFEGEDRNRNFFWSATPFYGREPFVRAMSCPEEFKANYLLYRLFIESLDPRLVDIESTTRGKSLRFGRSPINHLVRVLRQRAPRSLKRSWRTFRRRPVAGPALDCLREQLAASAPVADYISPSRGAAVLGQLDVTQSYMLLTLTAAIEYFTTGKSTLERYRDAPFSS